MLSEQELVAQAVSEREERARTESFASTRPTHQALDRLSGRQTRFRGRPIGWRAGVKTADSPSARSPEALTRAGDGPCFLNFTVWKNITGGSFLATERRLRAAAARLKPKAAAHARLELARFYLANGLPPKRSKWSS